MKILLRIAAVILFVFVALITYVIIFGNKSFDAPLPDIQASNDSTLIARGKYLSNNVANCYGCHTDRDLQSGSFIGEPFAGGFYMPPEPFSEGYSFVTPNLTPDPETGIIADWDEDLFLDRFKSGRVYKGTPMPWGAYSRMPVGDVKALYRYLQTLKPVHNKLEKLVFAPGEDLPARP